MVSPQDPSHRIIEQFGLKGTFKAHLVQHPCSEQGRLQLKHVAQTPVQPNLGHLPPLWASCSSFFQPLMIHSSGSSRTRSDGVLLNRTSWIFLLWSVPVGWAHVKSLVSVISQMMVTVKIFRNQDICVPSLLKLIWAPFAFYHFRSVFSYRNPICLELVINSAWWFNQCCLVPEGWFMLKVKGAQQITHLAKGKEKWGLALLGPIWGWASNLNPNMCM